MIARVWRGAVAMADSDAYAQYMQHTGITATQRRAAIAACGCCAAPSRTKRSL